MMVQHKCKTPSRLFRCAWSRSNAPYKVRCRASRIQPYVIYAEYIFVCVLICVMSMLQGSMENNVYMCDTSALLHGNITDLDHLSNMQLSMFRTILPCRNVKSTLDLHNSGYICYASSDAKKDGHVPLCTSPTFMLNLVIDVLNVGASIIEKTVGQSPTFLYEHLIFVQYSYALVSNDSGLRCSTAIRPYCVTDNIKFFLQIRAMSVREDRPSSTIAATYGWGDGPSDYVTRSCSRLYSEDKSYICTMVCNVPLSVPARLYCSASLSRPIRPCYCIVSCTCYVTLYRVCIWLDVIYGPPPNMSLLDIDFKSDLVIFGYFVCMRVCVFPSSIYVRISMGNLSKLSCRVLHTYDSRLFCALCYKAMKRTVAGIILVELCNEDMCGQPNFRSVHNLSRCILPPRNIGGIRLSSIRDVILTAVFCETRAFYVYVTLNTTLYLQFIHVRYGWSACGNYDPVWKWSDIRRTVPTQTYPESDTPPVASSLISLACSNRPDVRPDCATCTCLYKLCLVLESVPTHCSLNVLSYVLYTRSRNNDEPRSASYACRIKLCAITISGCDPSVLSLFMCERPPIWIIIELIYVYLDNNMVPFCRYMRHHLTAVNLAHSDFSYNCCTVKSDNAAPTCNGIRSNIHRPYCTYYIYVRHTIFCAYVSQFLKDVFCYILAQAVLYALDIIQINRPIRRAKEFHRDNTYLIHRIKPGHLHLLACSYVDSAICYAQMTIHELSDVYFNNIHTVGSWCPWAIRYDLCTACKSHMQVVGKLSQICYTTIKVGLICRTCKCSICQCLFLRASVGCICMMSGVNLVSYLSKHEKNNSFKFNTSMYMEQ